jgi:uncharacterized protein YggE
MAPMIKGVVTAVAAFALVALPGTANADTDKVSVTGQGRVAVRPDIMLVRAGVEVRRSAPQPTYQATSAAGRRLVAILREAGVAKKDIRTTDLSVQPEYVEGGSTISAYRGTESVSATVRNLDRDDEILAKIMAAGDDVRLHGISFDKDDWSEEMAKAETAAVRDARAKAERYAAAVGRTLGRVLSIRAETVDPVPAHFYSKEVVAAAGGHVVPPEGEARVTVHLTYALR